MKHPAETSRQEIREIFDRAGLKLSSAQVALFEKYEREILAWNHRSSLISKNDEVRLVSRHFLESAVLARFEAFRPGNRILDLGSGGGFPGLPLKIMRPDLLVTLLEATTKKAAFLKFLVETLAIEAVVVNERAETAARDQQMVGAFDLVVARAVAQLNQLVVWARPFLKTPGRLLTIKGSSMQEELSQLRKLRPYLTPRVEPFPGDWPGCEKLRLVEIEFTGEE